MLPLATELGKPQLSSRQQCYPQVTYPGCLVVMNTRFYRMGHGDLAQRDCISVVPNTIQLCSRMMEQPPSTCNKHHLAFWKSTSNLEV